MPSGKVVASLSSNLRVAAGDDLDRVEQVRRRHILEEEPPRPGTVRARTCSSRANVVWGWVAPLGTT